MLLPLVGCNGSPDRASMTDMKRVFAFILVLDTVKTVLMIPLKVLYREGWMAETFNRLPTIESQIYAALLIHAVLDICQCFATIFTIILAEWAKPYIKRGQLHEPLSDGVARREEYARFNKMDKTLMGRFVRWNI